VNARSKMVLAWTALSVTCWGSYTALVATHPQPDFTDEENAAVTLGTAACTAGCVGSVWLLGLVVGLVIYALVRRDDGVRA
jgi:hypothetical protein